MNTFLRLFTPPANTTSLKEKMLSGFASLLAISLVLFSSSFFLLTEDTPWIVASMGASAVLLFAVPLGPLSQPWSFVGGHLLSGFIGITVAKLVPDMLIASALAVSLAIFVMYVTSCLHPPGGATALSAVVGSSAVHDLGYAYLVTPVALNVFVMLVFALFINNLLPGRYYPNTLKAYREEKNKSLGDDKIQASLSISRENIKYALKEMGEFVDISNDNLGRIFNLSAAHARRQRMGEVLIGDIMTRSVVKAEYGDNVEDLWMLMAKHKIRSIPIVDKHNRIQGIITISDFLNQVKTPTIEPLKIRFENFLKRSKSTETDKPEYAGHLMNKEVITVHPDQHILDLFPIFYEKGIHHLPVVDNDNKLLGMTTPKNLLIALHADLRSL
ncbi:MAG TPA: HPP family protein [Leucothrix mucor]|uniref:HPP family protein n=1 Tax=Leucothrix mucor TaxID=45248 RepID=A0A7V2SY64_LEUMU|nr:HPP family protein [Leucothrix mucor]